MLLMAIEAMYPGGADNDDDRAYDQKGGPGRDGERQHRGDSLDTATDGSRYSSANIYGFTPLLTGVVVGIIRSFASAWRPRSEAGARSGSCRRPDTVPSPPTHSSCRRPTALARWLDAPNGVPPSRPASARSGLVAIRYLGSPVGSLGQQNPDLTLWQAIRSGSRKVRVYDQPTGRGMRFTTPAASPQPWRSRARRPTPAPDYAVAD